MGVENDIFWSEKGSGFGETGDTSLLRIPKSDPPTGGNTDTFLSGTGNN